MRSSRFPRPKLCDAAARNALRVAALSAALISAVCLAAPGSDAPAVYSQNYLVFLNGSPAGTESVEERTTKDGLISSSTHDIVVTEGIETKRLAFSTSLRLEKGTYAPLDYSCRYTSANSGDSYHVSVRKGIVTRSLTRAGHTSESSMAAKPGMVLVDLNVFHQFDYLYRHYDLNKAGRQTFSDYIPLIASDISLALTRLEDSELAGAKRSVAVQNFKVELVGVWMGVASFDGDGRLVRLFIQDKGIEVIRKDMQPE